MNDNGKLVPFDEKGQASFPQKKIHFREFFLMTAPNRPLTHEDLANDLGRVAHFLRTLEAASPGHVDEDLLANLEGMASNRIALDLLMNAMNAVQQQQQLRR